MVLNIIGEEPLELNKKFIYKLFKFEPINPIGDMDLEAYHEENLINDYLRTFVSRLTKSEPATSRNYIT